LRLQKLERKQYISTDPADLFYRVNSRIIAFVEGTVHRSNLVHVRRATHEDSLVFSLVEPTEYPTEEMTRFTDALAVEKLLKQLEQDGIPDLFACRHRSHILEKLLPKYVKKYLEVQQLDKKEAAGWQTLSSEFMESSIQYNITSTKKQMKPFIPDANKVLMPYLVNVQGHQTVRKRRGVGLPHELLHKSQEDSTSKSVGTSCKTTSKVKLAKVHEAINKYLELKEAAET
jgi:hypothetical protein